MTLTIDTREKKKIKKFIDKFRKENIPENYNQVAGTEQIIFNNEIDYLMSISSRTDGKSFNYIGMFLAIAIQFPKAGLEVCFFVRHYTLRQARIDLIFDIMDTMSFFDVNLLEFERGDFYTAIEYNGRVIAIIVDIPKSQDLKDNSSFIKKFPIGIYDEFITLPTDYVPSEDYHLAKIYSSIDRLKNRPTIKAPKFIFLGNPENFQSPVFSMTNTYNVLEAHPINTGKQYDNVYLEMFRNENQNAQMNSRALRFVGNAPTSGEFQVNKTYIARDIDRNRVEMNGFDYFHVKLEEGFLLIKYNLKTKETLLSFKPQADKYDYCTDIKDYKEGVKFLKENYYKETHWKYHERGKYWYDNEFTKTLIVNDNQLISLKLWRLVAEHRTRHVLDDELPEKQFEQISKREQVRAIQRKFFTMP